MIYLTHPLEGENEATLLARQSYGSFLTKKIQNYLKDFPIFNFPLSWVIFNQEMGHSIKPRETKEKALQFMAKADAAIIINFPGQELCERTKFERQALQRLDIPMVELPFAVFRMPQLIKQNSLSADQKRVLNLLKANLEESQQI